MGIENILPNKLQFDEINESLKQIANTRAIADFSDAPGSKYLLAGDRNAGFFGVVQASDLIDGPTLASEIGLTGGSAINSTTPWLKYIWKGKVKFIPLKPLRHSSAWNQIYNAGAVYGTSDEGTLPPNGRLGVDLYIEAADNSINTTSQRFLGDETSATDYADTVASVGDTITLKGWSNGANNGEFTVVSITDTKIVLSGGTLVTESGDKDSRIYKTSNAVTQNRQVVIGGLTYRVKLIKGANNDPLDSYLNSDRDMVGENSEWNGIILPLHERAKLGNWKYPAYAGAVDDWNIGLTDADLITHYLEGSGSYTWCQETNDSTTWRRVIRGYYGASRGTSHRSFLVSSAGGWRPVLELVG